MLDFPKNRFFSWYNTIVTQKALSSKEELSELHHIYPVSIVGESDKKVHLKIKHHYIAHYLLWRGFQEAYGDNHYYTLKMGYALLLMGYKPIRKKALETCIKKRELSKKMRNTDIARELNSQNIKKFFKNNPEAKTAISNHWTSFYAIPENKKRQSERLKSELSKDPERVRNFIEKSRTPEAIMRRLNTWRSKYTTEEFSEMMKKRAGVCAWFFNKETLENKKVKGKDNIELYSNNPNFIRGRILKNSKYSKEKFSFTR